MKVGRNFYVEFLPIFISYPVLLLPKMPAAPWAPLPVHSAQGGTLGALLHPCRGSTSLKSSATRRACFLQRMLNISTQDAGGRML